MVSAMSKDLVVVRASAKGDLLSSDEIRKILGTPAPLEIVGISRLDPTVPAESQEIIAELGCQVGRLAEALQRVLGYSRVRVIGGWRRGRCLACNVPHLFKRRCPCPHHKAEELLEELGIKVGE